MNARNLLIGIGIVAVVTGGVLGSGALTQVNAERTASVEVADDSAAAIGLSVANGTDSAIVASGSGNTMDLQLTNLNQNATTTTTAFNVTNNLNEAVGIQVGSSTSWLTIDNVNSSSTKYVTLNQGNTKTVEITIDTTSDSSYTGTSDSAEIVVIADSQQP